MPHSALRSAGVGTLQLPEPYSFVVTWFVVLPITFFIAQALTNTILKEALILKVNSLLCIRLGVCVHSFVI
jgi:hypothetical protein